MSDVLAELGGAFWRKVSNHFRQDSSMEVDDFLLIAQSIGLLEEVAYQPAQHSQEIAGLVDADEIEPGDLIFIETDLGKDLRSLTPPE